jgi:hypothetical protein
MSFTAPLVYAVTECPADTGFLYGNTAMLKDRVKGTQQ